MKQIPRFFTMEEAEVDEDEIWAGLSKAIDEAAEKFVESRIREGEHLKDDLIQKLNDMLAYVEYVKERAPGVIEDYKTGLKEKIRELLGDMKVDETRLLTEVAIFADKVCISENPTATQRYRQRGSRVSCCDSTIRLRCEMPDGNKPQRCSSRRHAPRRIVRSSRYQRHRSTP